MAKKSEKKRVILEKIIIKKLFGMYDYTIPIKKKQQVTIIYGANGTGKTTIIEMLDTLSKKSMRMIRTVPFASIKLHFNDGTLGIRKTKKHITFSYTRRDGKKESFKLHQRHSFETEDILLELLDRRPDLSHGDISEMNTSELIDTLFSAFPDDEIIITSNQIRQLRNVSRHMYPKTLEKEKLPRWLSNLLTKMRVFYIGAKRLYQPPSVRRSRVRSKLQTIVEYSNELAQDIEDVRAEYSSVSAELDRSFPSRVILSSVEASEENTPKVLAEILSKIDDKRTEIVRLGLLQESRKPTEISSEKLEDFGDQSLLVKFLDTYIKDSNDRLAVFADLMIRSKVFIDLVNRHLRDKRLAIEYIRRRGYSEGAFLIINSIGARVPLRKLSSGEQHLIIWSYALVFQPKENALVLIDEPELSLHVEWQLGFVDSIRELGSSSNLSYILATHSPQIINEQWDLTVSLDDQINRDNK